MQYEKRVCNIDIRRECAVPGEVRDVGKKFGQ